MSRKKQNCFDDILMNNFIRLRQFSLFQEGKNAKFVA